MIEKIASFGKILAVITAIIGILTFIGKTIDDYSKQRTIAESVRASDAREWARVTVVEILERSGAQSFTELHKKFMELGIPEAAVNRDELTERYLRRIVLSLYSDSVAYVRQDSKIDINRRIADEVSGRALEIQTQLLKQQEIRNAINGILSSGPPTRSVEDLTSEISDALQLDREAVKGVLSIDMKIGYLIINPNGNVQFANQRWTDELGNALSAPAAAPAP